MVMEYQEIKGKMDALMGDIRDIESQLGDRDRRDTWGDRMDGQSYWRWRKAASWARNKKVEEYRALKAQLHEMAQPRVRYEGVSRIERIAELFGADIVITEPDAIVALGDLYGLIRSAIQLCELPDSEDPILQRAQMILFHPRIRALMTEAFEDGRRDK